MSAGPTFADVLAAPEDLGLRAVWADALQLAGDPRGEFIALQLGPRNYASWSRERELVMQHGRRWAGALENYFSSPVFEGGVLVGGRLVGREGPACVEPEWRMITTLEHGGARRLLAHPHVPLRCLRELSEYELRELFLQPAQLTRIRELGIHLGRSLMRPLPGPPGEVLEQLEDLPDLHTLFVDGDRARVDTFLASSPLLDRLVQLGVTMRAYDERDLAPLLSLAAASRGALRELVLEVDPGWRVTLRREQPGPFTEVRAWWLQDRPQTSLQHAHTCVRVLGLIDRAHVRTLEIQIGRRMRPAASFFENLTALLADMPLERCEVPWEHAPRIAATHGERWTFEIAGCDTLEHLELLWETFGSRWNMVSVGGRAASKLGKQPLATIAKRLAEQRISLLRTGSTDKLELEPRRCRGSLTLDQDVATWFTRLLDELAPTGIASCGRFETVARLDLETYGSCAPGSIFVLPRALARGLTAAHLARLGAAAIAQEPRAFRLVDEPDTFDTERMAELRRSLVAVLDDVRAAEAPAWFAETVRAYVAPLGLMQTCDHPMRLAWGEIVVRLDDTTGPWRMAIKGVMGARGRYPSSPRIVESAADVHAELAHHSYVFEG
jgi:uncharacterized protein (TIGR02996 family)